MNQPPISSPRPTQQRGLDADDPPPVLDHHARARILNCAPQLINDRADPAAVLAAVNPLLAWVAKATTRADQDARLFALSHQQRNTVGQPIQSAEDFLAAAHTYYQFLAPRSARSGGQA